MDLAAGVHYRVLPNGVLHGPPPSRRVFGGGPPSADGGRLIEERFGNRQVVVRLQIVGASKDDLIAAVRRVQDLLDRARERETSGFGSPVRLTLRWDGATNDFALRVLDGRLVYPATLWSRTFLGLNTRIEDARLELVCAPFAEGGAVQLAAATLTNDPAATPPNYVDALAVRGDVGAPAAVKLTPSGATGEKKTFVGTRSGVRRGDTLWRHGESVDREDQVGGEQRWTYTAAAVSLTEGSGGSFRRFTLTRGLGASPHPAGDLWTFAFDLGASFSPRGCSACWHGSARGHRGSANRRRGRWASALGGSSAGRPSRRRRMRARTPWTRSSFSIWASFDCHRSRSRTRTTPSQRGSSG